MRMIYGLRLAAHCICIPSEVVMFLSLSTKYCFNNSYAPNLSVRGKDHDLGEVKSEKSEIHWTIANKKLFLDLCLRA